MQIVIVEDDIQFARTVEAVIRDFFTARKEAVEIQCLEGTTLLGELNRQKDYDIYLFDVEMPRINGLELAQKVRFMDADARIIFLTSYEEYALRSIKIGAYYYILKDSYERELFLILERICKEEEESRKDYYVILTKSHGYKVLMDNILYLTKEKKYAFFQCQNGAVYSERDSLENIYKRLPQERFIMIERGIIVNMKHVMQFAKLEVTMRDGRTFSVSRRMIAEVRERLADYWGEV